MTTGVIHESITLSVNGQQRVVLPGTTLATLLRELRLDPRMIVVEHNRTILRDREHFGTRVLGDGDTLELVHFVGGG